MLCSIAVVASHLYLIFTYVSIFDYGAKFYANFMMRSQNCHFGYPCMYECMNVCFFLKGRRNIFSVPSNPVLVSFVKRQGTGSGYDQVLKLYVIFADSWLFYGSFLLNIFY